MTQPLPDFLRRIAVSFAISALLLCGTVHAGHAGEYVYSPEGCEFQLTFPNEPYETERCHDKVPDKCTRMTTYTQVFDMNAAVNFYVICRPSEESYREQFSPDLMRTSLLARPNVDKLEVYDISWQDTDEAVAGSLIGAGKSPNGKDQMVYVTQIWVGDASVLTFEGEMMGIQTDAADDLFAVVLGSLRHKNWTPESDLGDSENSKNKETEEKTATE